MDNAETNAGKSSRDKLILILIGLYLISIGTALFQILRRGEGKGMAFGRLGGKANAVAVVQINGVITGSSRGGGFSRPPSADKIARRLKALGERDDMKAVVLRVESPGGSVGAVQEIYDEVARLRKSGKKVVASMGDIAASGGYYVSAAADKIYADPGTITGSIGVIFQVGNVQELFKKFGVRMEAVKSSAHKDIGSPFRAMSEEERKIFQSIINDAYGQFIDAIVRGRNMPREKVLKLADGRVYTGAQAKAAGLIDELGGLQTAVKAAAELAGIQEKPRLLYEEDPLEKFFGFLGTDSRSSIAETALSGMGMRFAYLWDYALQ